jgi:hypothetical protein
MLERKASTLPEGPAMHLSISNMRAATLAVAMMALVLAGCHTVPLGDPEKSAVDPKLAGWWEADTPGGLMHVHPYDKHTYLVTFYVYELAGDRIKPQARLAAKAWHAQVAGMDVISVEVVNPEWELAAGEKAAARYAYFRYKRVEMGIELLPMNLEFLNDAKTPAQLEKKIADNLQNPELFRDKDPIKFKQLPDGSKEKIWRVIHAFTAEGAI